MKNISSKELILWGAILLVIGAMVYSAVQEQKDQEEMVGKSAPALTLKTTGGEKVDIRDLRGELVILNVYATWCPPCKDEIPDFARFYDHIKSEDLPVHMFGIVYESGPPAKAEQKSKAIGTNYPILMGSPPVARRYKLDTYPTTILIGREGQILRRIEGPLSYEMLDDLVQKAL